MRYPGQREDLTPLEWRQRLHDKAVRRKVHDDAAAAFPHRYCVYVHRDRGGRIRYVGHGQRHRAWCCRRSHHRHVEYLIHGDLTVDLVADGISARKAVALETRLIEYTKGNHDDAIFNVLDGTLIETTTGETK